MMISDENIFVKDEFLFGEVLRLIQAKGEAHPERPWLVIAGSRAGELQIKARKLVPDITRSVKFVSTQANDQCMLQKSVMSGASILVPDRVFLNAKGNLDYSKGVIFLETDEAFSRVNRAELVPDIFLTLLLLKKLSANFKGFGNESAEIKDQLIQQWFFQEFGGMQFKKDGGLYFWDYQVISAWFEVKQLIAQSA